MQNAIELIIEFTMQTDLDGFLHDRKTQLSIERLLEILGEAANYITPELKANYPDVPWRQITDLRNVVSHQYFQVRVEVVWDVATQNIPVLARQIQRILQEMTD